MKQTKANIVRVLKAMQRNSMAMRDLVENEEEKRRYLQDAMVFDQSIWAITDKVYFDKMVEIFGVGKEQSDES